jgi:ATP-dependent DNA ligase
MSTALECDPRRPKPRWAGPMLAVLTDERFSCDEWLFERKLDGERCLASRRGTGLRLLARTHDGKLRHPRFLGLRRDKPPREVVLERPAR